MSATTKRIQEEESEITTFLVCDDSEQTWLLVEAKTIDEAIVRSKRSGWDPYYIVERNLTTNVWDEEKRKNEEKTDTTAEDPQEGSKATSFLVCEDSEQAWFLVKSINVDKAIREARKSSWNPHYVVEKNLATNVWNEERNRRV